MSEYGEGVPRRNPLETFRRAVGAPLTEYQPPASELS